MEHQRIAANCMLWREGLFYIPGGEAALKEGPMGLILADEMGLGKTLSVLAMVADAKIVLPEPQPTLVITKASGVDHWMNEIAKHLPIGTLTVTKYHGPKRFTKSLEVDLVLTSYHVLINSNELIKKKWRRVILDDAHLIRNEATLMSKKCMLLRTKYRYAVTGIPIQNSEYDLHPLLRFVGYEKSQNFRYVFIRREKSQLSYYDPPNVEFVEVPVELAVAERECYENATKFFKKVHRSTRGVFNLMVIMRLRQLCIHSGIVVRRTLCWGC